MTEGYRKAIRTTCPVCARDLAGTEYGEDGRIFLAKACPEHGEVTDLVSSDARLYIEKMGRRERDYHRNCLLEVCSQGVCPHHLTREAEWGFIEVTTRCNMRCPVCYAASEWAGEDVPLDGLRKIIDHIAEKGVVREFILIGGEPTLREDIFEVLGYIREKGLIKNVYLGTNGLKLVDPGYCLRLRETGLKRIELPLDSIDPGVCRQIRGSLAAYEALPKVLDNLRKLKRIKVQLTVTVCKGLNDRTLGDSLKWALENSDIVKQVIISPQQFCGRLIETEALAEKRLTLECIENILREAFGGGPHTVSMEAGLSFLEPLRRMGILDIDRDFPMHIHPQCASFGFIWRVKGPVRSLFERVLRKGCSPYDMSYWANALSKKIQARRSRVENRFGAGTVAKLLWGLAVYLGYLPRYLCKALSCTRPAFWLSVAASPFRRIAGRNGWREAVFGPQHIWLLVIFLGDEFNFSWERLPYCMDFQYMIHPRTGEVTKVPTCLYISHRRKVLNSQRTAAPVRCCGRQAPEFR